MGLLLSLLSTDEISIAMVISVVLGVFVLIVLYKVWGMTDDVKEIKKMLAEKMRQDNNRAEDGK